MIHFKTFLNSEEGRVKKYIYEDETALVETVIYKYPDYKTRTTICVSVQSGCKVGCTFCGTGAAFLRNLSSEEILLQVSETFEKENVPLNEVELLQIMFMSMGEPSHNWVELEKAIRELNIKYPKAQLLVSTVGTKNKAFLNGMLCLSKEISKIGLQFSIHHFDDDERNKLIPMRAKMNLKEIADYGRKWFEATGRNPYCNYVVVPENSSGFQKLFEIFPKEIFKFTFSVLCASDETIKSSLINNKDEVQKVHDDFLKEGYDVRLFDPYGQDTIGGGCGQLWFFQDRVKNMKTNNSHVFISLENILTK